MAYGLRLRRGGAYNRLAEPTWVNPLDVGFSRRGGRWNAPDTFAVLYLNATVRVARLQVHHRLAGHPYGVEDLDPAEQHDLVDVDVPTLDVLDALTDDGLAAVGLPTTYPRHPDGRPVAWAECQPVGRAAFDDRRPGLACRSAASGADRGDEELAVFEGAAERVTQTGRRPFAAWYWS